MAEELNNMKAMTTLLKNGLPASYVMDAVKGPLVIKLDEECIGSLCRSAMGPMAGSRSVARQKETMIRERLSVVMSC